MDKSSTVLEAPGNLPVSAPAEIAREDAPSVGQSRAFQLTNRLLYPTDPDVGLDKEEIEEITETCKTSWNLQKGHLTEDHIREISRCIRKGLLVGKPALPPFKHQAFVLNCSILARNAAKRKMAVVWNNIIEDAFDMAWNTTCPHPSGRGAWSSQVIVIDN
ncbi:hypothetical protein N0V85_003859 [Neurospora sp. IMI 360204]|nr:hypothetical protein N0V85_003859 [Neurospora sp. IMI 360204]